MFLAACIGASITAIAIRRQLFSDDEEANAAVANFLIAEQLLISVVITIMLILSQLQAPAKTPATSVAPIPIQHPSKTISPEQHAKSRLDEILSD